MKHESGLKWFFFACLIVVFFLTQQNAFTSLQLTEGKSAYAVAEAVKEGTPSRQIGFLFLALISLLSLTGKGQTRFQINGILGWLILGFLFWVILSISWAINKTMVVRKVTVLGIFCLGAYAFARRYEINDIVLFSLVVSGCFLVIGVGTETMLGTLRPHVSGYRFAGTQHPNLQGVNCATLFLAAVAMIRLEKRHRRLLVGVVIAAVAGLLLTRSRGALVAALLGYLTYFFLTASRAKKLSSVLLISGFTTLLLLIFSDDFVRILERFILLGREGDSELSGRTPLWDLCLTYVAKRPLHGYGFNAFWTEKTVYEISGSLDWSMAEAHSVYIDLALGTGLGGLSVFVLIFLIGIRRYFVFYRSSLDARFAFCCALLVLGTVDGIMESTTINAEWPSFLYFVILARAGVLQLPTRITKKH